MEADKARKVKIGLAALAVLGLGAALTSAAWEDEVFFTADIEAGEFNLQGAVPADQSAPVEPTTGWLESDDPAAIELDLGTAQFAPDETTTLTGYVRLDPTSTWTGDLTTIELQDEVLPTGVTASVDWAAGAVTTGIEPGDVAAFEVTLTADGTAVQGDTGSLVVHVQGESVDPFTAP